MLEKVMDIWCESYVVGGLASWPKVSISEGTYDEIFQVRVVVNGGMVGLQKKLTMLKEHL